MKRLKDLPPVSRAQKGPAKKWRVIFQFLPDGLPPEKEQTNEELYPTLDAARWGYRATLRALQRCKHLTSWKISLNKSGLPAWENPRWEETK